MAAGEQRSVADALRKTYTDVASMMLLPDAQVHSQFLQGLMGGIQKYLQQQASAAAQMAGGAQAGMGGPGGGVGQNPGGAGAPPGMRIAPGGGSGMSGLMGAVPPQLLQQLVAAGGQQGGPPG